MVRPGKVLLGKYCIERVLGKGGMGLVARAHHLQLNVPVAIKFLLPEVLERPGVVRRFLREAQAAVQLKSEHVSRVIDVGTLESGAPYMVMEFLEGRDLGNLLRETGPLAPGFAVDLALQACEALAEAHALGMVHRDIKPANFFLTTGPGGVPLLKVLDFGISKAPLPAANGLTRTNAILGTPAYMSPEQIKSSKYVDARTDIWALGVALYELVSGRKPFRGEGYADLAIVLANQPMYPLADIELPPGLEQVIARCLAKDPNDRFQNMAELAVAMAPFADTPIQAARSTEHTQRLLAMATAPLQDAPPVRSTDELDTETLSIDSTSTLRDSESEQVSADTTTTRMLRSARDEDGEDGDGAVAAEEVHKAAVAAPVTKPIPTTKPGGRRGDIIAAAVMVVLGGAVGGLVAVQGNCSTAVEVVPDSAGTPLAPTSEAALSGENTGPGRQHSPMPSAAEPASSGPGDSRDSTARDRANTPATAGPAEAERRAEIPAPTTGRGEDSDAGHAATPAPTENTAPRPTRSVSQHNSRRSPKAAPKNQTATDHPADQGEHTSDSNAAGTPTPERPDPSAPRN